MLANAAYAEDAVTSLSAIEGEWEGKVQVGGLAGFLELKLGVTSAGAILGMQQLTLSCEYVVAPTIKDGMFDAFLVKDVNNNCENGKVTFAVTDGQLGVKLVDQWQSVGALSQTNGPAIGERVFPDAAIKGVTMGTPLDQLDGLLPAGGKITPEQSSRKVVRALKQLNGTYRQISVPYSEPEFTKHSQDNLAFYNVPNDANEGVMAITRFYSPSPLQATTFASYEAALIETYGQPAQTSKESRSVMHHWHYGLDGQPATGIALESCTRHIRSSTSGPAAAMLFSALKFSVSGRANEGKGSLTPKLLPRPNCGYSLEYFVRRKEDGSLQDAQAVFYDHRALATEMWPDKAEDLQEEVEKRLAYIKAAATNAPDL
jgi:hypothetical protein